MMKYVNLWATYLLQMENNEIKEIQHIYKDAFSLEDEIGACPNIEIKIDVVDKSRFFIRPHHLEEEDKKILDKEIKRASPFGYSQRRLPSIFKASNDYKQENKLRIRGLSPIWHLTTRIVKNNSAFGKEYIFLIGKF